jgi:hypothetical protein
MRPRGLKEFSPFTGSSPSSRRTLRSGNRISFACIEFVVGEGMCKVNYHIRFSHKFNSQASLSSSLALAFFAREPSKQFRCVSGLSHMRSFRAPMARLQGAREPTHSTDGALKTRRLRDGLGSRGFLEAVRQLPGHWRTINRYPTTNEEPGHETEQVCRCGATRYQSPHSKCLVNRGATCAF